jgi:hypothetical protein
MDEVAGLKLPVPPYDVTRLDLAIKRFTALEKQLAYRAMRNASVDEFKPITVSFAPSALELNVV